jgi:magnesium-transporting ATPase (P-type)
MVSLPGNASIITNDEIIPVQNTVSPITVSEIYLDRRLMKAEAVDESDKNYGIFMHSLTLSNYAEVMQINSNQVNVTGDEFEKAIFYYTASKGFNKNFIESIAPKVNDIKFEDEENFITSTHLINEKMRIVSRGTPDELLNRCTYILLDSRLVKITRRILREVTGVLNDMLNRCLCVYAVVIKDILKTSQTLNENSYISGMTMVALVGMGR